MANHPADESYHERGRWMLHIGTDWALLDIENCGEPIRARVTHDDLYALRALLDDVLDPSPAAGSGS